MVRSLLCEGLLVLLDHLLDHFDALSVLFELCSQLFGPAELIRDSLLHLVDAVAYLLHFFFDSKFEVLDLLKVVPASLHFGLKPGRCVASVV